jgi:hypothetical protein
LGGGLGLLRNPAAVRRIFAARQACVGGGSLPAAKQARILRVFSPYLNAGAYADWARPRFAGFDLAGNFTGTGLAQIDV